MGPANRPQVSIAKRLNPDGGQANLELKESWRFSSSYTEGCAFRWSGRSAMTKRGAAAQFNANAYLSTTGCGLADGHCWWSSNSGTSNVRRTEWWKVLILCHRIKRLVPIDVVSAWNVERTALRQPEGGAVKAYAARGGVRQVGATSPSKRPVLCDGVLLRHACRQRPLRWPWWTRHYVRSG